LKKNENLWLHRGGVGLVLPSLLALTSLLALASCGEEPPPPQYPVTFSAHADEGAPLEGVQITGNGAPLGTTNAQGMLAVTLTGPEGTPVRIGAQCPDGHRNPGDIPVLTLRRVVSLDPSSQNGGIRMTIHCPPSQRNAVVVVRADGQSDMPVLLDGREVARTDRSGVAHFAVRMAPNVAFQVRLATEHLPLLRPQEPRQTFTVPDHDELFIFDQSFSVEEPRRRRRRRRRVHRGPVRIGGGR
jgi:hypothetical protein